MKTTNGYGPQTDFGRIMHAMKYRGPEETFDDYCVRYARTVADTEPEFRRLIRLLREQVVLPAGRQQLAVGRPHQTTAFNCLSGDTEVLTASGYRRLDAMEGERVYVLSPVSGTFEEAKVKSYGKQALFIITISNASNGNGRAESFKVKATGNHRWVLQDGSVTEELGIGQVLKGAASDIDCDPDGWMHGFVYGDGTKIRDEVEGKPRSNPAFAEEYPFKKFMVRLCGKKAAHLSKFSDGSLKTRTTYPQSNEGDPLVMVFSKRDLKELPSDDETAEYTAGFVNGLLAADGCFSNRGNDSFQFHGGENVVRWMRDHLIYADYVPSGRAHEATAKATHYGERTEPLWVQLFRPSSSHKGFRVLDIKPAGTTKVYCVEEPKHKQIVLRNGLRTGNCFVGDTIQDSTDAIFDAVKAGAMTLRSGGGVGWDFSTLRPNGDPVRGLGHGAKSSGPVSFMHVWHAMCSTIMSAGERRGAMMGCLRIDHPDVLSFVRAKQDQRSLTNFNISLLVTDEFMEALAADKLFTPRFGRNTYAPMRAQDVWGPIMESNWDYAEPGVLFVDRINRLNPLAYCETISATNPCAEQPLPPNGACLLGSVNVLRLLTPAHEINGPALAAEAGRQTVRYIIDYDLLRDAVDAMVRAFDNVIDRTTYPLQAQKAEALAKRRMGVGVTGMANALEVMGFVYGTPQYIEAQGKVLDAVLQQSYRTSMELAREKGTFPLWDTEKYCSGEFFNARINPDLRELIRRHGLRNGLLTSIAPTGTISLTADNVSSGIEPVFQHRYERDILTPDGKQTFEVIDAAFNQYGVRGRAADEVTAEEHIDVLCGAQGFVDSSISKTCNVAGQIGGEGPGMSYRDFVKLYTRAYEGGSKGCTTFNIHGKRMGILRKAEADDPGGLACTFDPVTGERSCEV